MGNRRPMDCSETTDFWIKLKRRFNFSEKQRRRYISHSIEALAGKLDLFSAMDEGAAGSSAIQSSIADAITEARRGLAQENNNHALFSLHEARRLALHIQSTEELKAQTVFLRNEAKTPQFEELRATMETHVENIDALQAMEDSAGAVAQLEKLYEIRDMHIEGQFISKARLSLILFVLSVLLSVTSGLVLYTFKDYCFLLSDGGLDFLACGDGSDEKGAEPLWLVSTLGALGATLSAIMGFSTGSKIPDLFTSLSAILVRPIIGGVSGLVGLCIMSLGFLNVGDSMAALFLIIIAFGFSERLVLGAISRVDFRQEN